MIGFGYDSHRLVDKGELILGGIEIACEFGVVAHSDGDALVHALIDALLGASGLGDIGTFFPDTDKKYKGADSIELLRKIWRKISKEYKLINIDATIILEKPKLALYKPLMRKKIADCCRIDVGRVNIKAKTNEKMGFVGRNEGVVCYCVCQIEAI